MVLKSIIIAHRYLGVVLGLVMTIWCLSGFVMMYQSFPETTQEERLAGLEPLDLAAIDAMPPLADEALVGAFRIEMLGGSPVLRMGGRSGDILSLATGEKIVALDEAGVRRAAEAFAAGNALSGAAASVERIETDQWTVALARRAQPLWKVALDDPGRTLVYVNGASGEVVQDANAAERWLSWFGAIPHWLYPSLLRANQPLWYETVVWLSAIGCFLVVTGLIIGLAKLRGRSGKWFPYKRPMWLWHHVLGTFAGVLVLTWTFSGLLTMTPWGLLESESAVSRSDFQSEMTWGEARMLIERAKAELSSNDIATLRSSPLLGKPYLVARARSGEDIRIGVHGVEPLRQAELADALKSRGGLLASGTLDVLSAEDAYYYGHKQAADLPVYRLILDDPDETRVYFDHETGEVRRIADATAKRYRWLESGLHSLDFSFLRARPLWDVVVIILLAAVTAACATGAWMSFTRVGRDAGRLKAMLQKK